MKKISMIGALLLTIMTVLVGCGSNESDSANSTADKASTQTDEKVISEDEAKKIAIEHAEIAEAEVTFAKVKLEMDDGVQEYEVEFYTQDTEYDYNIDAVTGEIRSFDNELENRTGMAQEGAKAGIAIEDATALALEKVPGATDANIRIQEERDDDRSIYEGTILYENKEYDFEIDATSGEFLDWSID